MFRHGPTCLDGPITRARPCWFWNEEFPVSQADEPEVDFRADLVARIRREIAEGTYDTPEKWEAALERLLERLTGGEGPRSAN
jgi:hypothetical protein